MTTTILAIDPGKFNRVPCWDKPTARLVEVRLRESESVLGAAAVGGHPGEIATAAAVNRVLTPRGHAFEGARKPWAGELFLLTTGT